MTKEEAIAALNNGEKLTHKLFTANEFIIKKGDNLEDELGFELDWDEFWAERTRSWWNKDWTIFKA